MPRKTSAPTTTRKPKYLFSVIVHHSGDAEDPDYEVYADDDAEARAKAVNALLMLLPGVSVAYCEITHVENLR